MLLPEENLYKTKKKNPLIYKKNNGGKFAGWVIFLIKYNFQRIAEPLHTERFIQAKLHNTY